MTIDVTKQSGFATLYSEDLAVSKQSAFATFYMPNLHVTKQTAYITFYPQTETKLRRRMPLIIN